MAFTNLVKKMNEKNIIACMRDGMAHTKQELAGLTGLSFPTVGKIVEELADGGMLLRLGTKQESPGGRKAEVYRLNADFAHMLLMFLQGNAVSYRICDALGAVKSEGRKQERACREKEERKQRTGRQEALSDEPSLPGMVELLRACAEEATAADGKISAVSIGIPGSVHNGTVCCIDGYAEMEGRNLAAELSAGIKMPVAVGNNMSLVARGMAEQLKKNVGGEAGWAGRRSLTGKENGETLVCIHLADTGPGMGAVVNGRALQGFSGFQGEVGFMPLYGDDNIQKIAMDGFRQAAPGECLGKMAACICTVLNPEHLICYLEWEQPGLAEEIVRRCERYLPAYAMPRFIFDRNYGEDYFHGLAVSGMELLYGGAESEND